MTTALFVHHSVGRQLLEDGGLRHLLATGDDPVDLWDHDYNEVGLTDPDGVRVGRSFVPADDTDPAGLVALLAGLATHREEWKVPDHDVLVLKSCFPNNHLGSPEALAEAQATYRRLAGLADALPQHVVLLSSPPLVPEASGRTAARHADALAAWLAASWPAAGRSYGDLFAALSHRHGPLRGMLRTDYRRLRRGDSHPNVRGARRGARVAAAAIRAAR